MCLNQERKERTWDAVWAASLEGWRDMSGKWTKLAAGLVDSSLGAISALISVLIRSVFSEVLSEVLRPTPDYQ